VTTATLINTTVTQNTASDAESSAGGGIIAEDSMALDFSDVIDNTAPDGANISDVPPQFSAVKTTVRIFASVITQPHGTGQNCTNIDTLTSAGYNFADDTSCGLSQPTDNEGPGRDPHLGTLSDNGGHVPTLLPTATSPLLDAIPNAVCQNAGDLATDVDARDLPRPDELSGRCDIGAVEIQHAPPPQPAEPPSPTDAPVAVPIIPRFTG
jgi:hypothetical protein